MSRSRRGPRCPNLRIFALLCMWTLQSLGVFAAGAFSGELKNKFMEKAKEEAKFASTGLAEPGFAPAKGWTGTHVLEATGLGTALGANFTPLVFTELNGKTGLNEEVGGVVIGRVYYGRKVAANEVEVAFTKAQAESATAGEHVEPTAEIKTTSKVVLVAEAIVTARIATGFGTVANGKVEDGTAREIESNAAAQKIGWVMYFTASSAGTLVFASQVETKELGKGDIYKVTKGQMEADFAA